MNKLTAAVLALGVLVLGALPALAQVASDYKTSTIVTISNETGSTLTDVVIPVTFHASNFIDSGLLASDGNDVFVLDGGTERDRTVMLNGNTTAWLYKVPSLVNGETVALQTYTGRSAPDPDQTTGGLGQNYGASGTGADVLGQVFYASAATDIAAVRISSKYTSGANTRFYMQLRTVSANAPTTTILATSEQFYPGTATAFHDVYAIFPESVALTAGTQYALVIHAVGGNELHQWEYVNATAVAGGGRVWNTGSWAVSSTSSRNFSVYEGMVPQRWYLQSGVVYATSSTSTTAFRTDYGRIRFASLTVDAFPSSGTEPVATNGHHQAAGVGWGIRVAADGSLQADLYLGSALLTATSTTDLAVDTAYDVELRYCRGGASSPCTASNEAVAIWINNVPEATATGDAGTSTSGFANLRIGSVDAGAFKAQVAAFEYAYNNTSYASNGSVFTLAPATFQQTQAGASGNGWVTKGWLRPAIEQTNPENLEYKVVRDTTNITIGAEAAVIQAPNTASTTSLGDPTVFDTSFGGTIDDPFGDSFDESNAVAWPLSLLTPGFSASNVPMQLISAGLALILAAFVGGAALFASRIPAVGLISALLTASTVVYMTPLADIIIVMMVLTTMAIIFIRPQMWERV